MDASAVTRKATATAAAADLTRRRRAIARRWAQAILTGACVCASVRGSRAPRLRVCACGRASRRDECDGRRDAAVGCLQCRSLACLRQWLRSSPRFANLQPKRKHSPAFWHFAGRRAEQSRGERAAAKQAAGARDSSERRAERRKQRRAGRAEKPLGGRRRVRAAAPLAQAEHRRRPPRAARS